MAPERQQHEQRALKKHQPLKYRAVNKIEAASLFFLPCLAALDRRQPAASAVRIENNAAASLETE
jgi:hypothetical protein